MFRVQMCPSGVNPTSPLNSNVLYKVIWAERRFVIRFKKKKKKTSTLPARAHKLAAFIQCHCVYYTYSSFAM